MTFLGVRIIVDASTREIVTNMSLREVERDELSQ